jgi:hypothetical protein
MTDYTSPRCRLAIRTSSQQCVPSMQNGFMTTVYAIFNSCITHSSLHGSALSITADDLGSTRKRPEPPNGIQYP